MKSEYLRHMRRGGCRTKRHTRTLKMKLQSQKASQPRPRKQGRDWVTLQWHPLRPPHSHTPPPHPRRQRGVTSSRLISRHAGLNWGLGLSRDRGQAYHSSCPATFHSSPLPSSSFCVSFSFFLALFPPVLMYVLTCPCHGLCTFHARYKSSATKNN